MTQECSYNELYPLQVLDDSMAPEFPEKCVIVIEPAEVCATGAYVVAEAEDDRWFRRFVRDEAGSERLVALNGGYPTIELKKGEYKIVGVIVQCNNGRKVTHYKPMNPITASSSVDGLFTPPAADSAAAVRAQRLQQGARSGGNGQKVQAPAAPGRGGDGGQRAGQKLP